MTGLFEFRRLQLENKGPVARDHLANERTFLAWLRTSLTFASIGVALTQFFRLNDKGDPDVDTRHFVNKVASALGGLFVSFAIVLIFVGVLRYFKTQALLRDGKFPVSRGLIAIVSFGTLSLIVITLGVLLAVADRRQ